MSKCTFVYFHLNINMKVTNKYAHIYRHGCAVSACIGIIYNLFTLLWHPAGTGIKCISLYHPLQTTRVHVPDLCMGNLVQ